MCFFTFSIAPAASEDTVIGVLGQSVTLPCQHTSWSRHRNSMCWGKGACPNSKCNEELVHTDGIKMISRKSIKYTLQGIVWQGHVSLTITNTNQGDSGVYCCRIEVPGWFNDVKKTVRLELRRGEERMGVNSEESSVVSGNRFIQWVLVASSADLSSGGEGWVSNGEPQNVRLGTHILVPARKATETSEGIQPINGRVRRTMLSIPGPFVTLQKFGLVFLGVSILFFSDSLISR